MLDTKTNSEVTVRIAPKTETLLGEICTAVKNMDEGLDAINYLEPHRFNPEANFHNHDAALPDVTLGELVGWINTFACIEGPELARQQPAGEALIKGRARQLAAMLKPLSAKVNDIANDPSYRGHQPFLFCALAHPKVAWAFDELCTKIGLLAK